MCVDDDSRPPIHPITGDSAGSTAARATAPTGAGVVVIPDVRGLHQYYKDLSDRFAEVGLDAVAIDFFARTAPKRARLAECHRQWLTSPTGEG